MAEETKCEVCQKPALQKCGGCHTVYYCSKEHQKVGWKTHRKSCRPFKVSEDEILGRYLIATKHIKPGEVILTEPPLIWGPAQITIPVCLGCARGLNSKSSRPCQKCGWPMCSELCQNSPSHIPECSYTVKRGDKVTIKNFNIPHPSYQCITVLRCLYQKQFLSDVWDKIDRLQSHCAERKMTPRYEQDRRDVVEFIKRFFKLENFEDEEVLRVCGIVMVNGHEVPLKEPAHVALYETTSLFEHSCRANCTKSFTSNGGVLISAGTSITKGEHLSICYTDPLWGMANRRHHLLETKFFRCTCARCQDPTENATDFNSVKCRNGSCKGVMLPKTFLEETAAATGLDGDWHCNQCKARMCSGDVHDILERIGRHLQAMPKGESKSCKAFLRKYEGDLPQNHFHMTDVRFALSQIIGRESENGLLDVPDDDLELKAKLCRQLADLVKILAPAEKRILGLLSFELQATTAELGHRKARAGVFGPDEIRSSLLESKRLLLDVIDLLKHEPAEMPEGKILLQAKMNLEEVDAILRTLHKTIGDSPL